MQQPRQSEQYGPDLLVVLVLILSLLIALPCVILVLLSRLLPRQLADRRAFWTALAVMGSVDFGYALLLAHLPSAHMRTIFVTTQVPPNLGDAWVRGDSIVNRIA